MCRRNRRHPFRPGPAAGVLESPSFFALEYVERKMKLSRLLHSGTVFLLLAVTALAQDKPAGTRRLTIEDTLEWRMASRPALSPDGKFVAYIVSENDLERSRVTSQLWRVNTETRETRRLTQADD